MADKVHAITVGIYHKDEEHERMQTVADRFTRLNGIPVRIITGRDLAAFPLSLPHFGRYYGWRFVPEDTEKLIYFDTDILPMRPLPALPDVDFAAVKDIDSTNRKVWDSFPLLRKKQVYFNSGFFIAGPKSKPIFERLLDRQTNANGMREPWCKDQTMLNVEVQLAVERGEITFELLPKIWNYIAAADPEYIADPYMLHFTAIPSGGSHGRGKLLDYFAKRLDAAEQGRK